MTATTETNDTYDIIIAGGGFAGMTLGIALILSMPKNFRVAIIDNQDPAKAGLMSSDGRASALSAASKQMLDILGVWSHVSDDAQPITDIDLTDSSLNAAIRPTVLHYENILDNDTTTTITDSANKDSANKPATWMLENYRLRNALVKTLSTIDQLDYLAPETVTDMERDDHGVTTTLASGQKIRGRLLVAADGRRSKLRTLAGIKTVSWSYPQIGIVTTVTIEKPHNATAIQHFLPSGPFAILPLKNNRASLVWTEDDKKGRAIMELDDAAFLKELEIRFGRRLGALELSGPRMAYPMETHLARSYISNRLALIGDAAHGVHPIAGQGLNLALRDVAALTEVLVDTARLGLDIGAGEPLERYERWRRFDNTLSTLVFDGFNRLFSSDNAALRSFRDFGLGLVDRSPALKSIFVKEAAGLSGEVPRLLKGERV